MATLVLCRDRCHVYQAAHYCDLFSLAMVMIEYQLTLWIKDGTTRVTIAIRLQYATTELTSISRKVHACSMSMHLNTWPLASQVNTLSPISHY